MIWHKDHGRWCHQRDNSSVTDWSFACQSVNWRWNINITRMDYSIIQVLSTPRLEAQIHHQEITFPVVDLNQKEGMHCKHATNIHRNNITFTGSQQIPIKIPIKSNLIWTKLRAKYKVTRASEMGSNRCKEHMINKWTFQKTLSQTITRHSYIYTSSFSFCLYWLLWQFKCSKYGFSLHNHTISSALLRLQGRSP